MKIDLTAEQCKDVRNTLLIEMRRNQEFMSSVAILPVDDALFAALNDRINRLNRIYDAITEVLNAHP